MKRNFQGPEKFIRSVIGGLIRCLFRRRILLPIRLSIGTDASNLLNKIIEMRRFTGRYLEIGVENGLTLEAVRMRRKFGVDPFPNYRSSLLTPSVKSFTMESDDFFKRNRDIFEVIYLDGLHTAEQTLRDFSNVIMTMKRGGVIVIDDTIPIDEYSFDGL